MVFTVEEPYIPLIQKLLSLKNYDDIKVVVDVGIYNLNLLKEYNKSNINVSNQVVINDNIDYYKKEIEHQSNLLNTLREQNQNYESSIDIMRNEFYQEKTRIYQEIEERKEREIEKYKEMIESMNESKNKLLKEMEEIQKNNYIEKEELRNTLSDGYKREIMEYKNTLKTKEQQLETLVKTFETIKREEIERVTNELQREKQRLNNEIDYYKKLYVDKSKGSFYEKELLPLLEKYNNNKLNNKWRIIHVGSSCNEKCDFQFRNKDTGDIILIDTKNNESHKPVPYKDVDKFIKDIEKEDNQAIGGILLANSYITNKKSFEMDTLNNKTYIYVSNFSFNNVEFIFSMIDLICEQSKSLKNKFDEENIRTHYIEQYKFLLDRVRVLNQERKKYEEEINRIKSKYYSLFNDDIDIKHKGLETKEVEKIVIKDIINFDELEKDCKIVGKRRTKYYLKYNDGKKDIVQYFANNYPKKERMNKLKQMKGVKIYDM